LQDYKNIFIKVNKWGGFEPSDLERNQIRDAQDVVTTPPGFVTAFEQKVVIKPRLHPDVRRFLDFDGLV